LATFVQITSATNAMSATGPHQGRAGAAVSSMGDAVGPILGTLPPSAVARWTLGYRSEVVRLAGRDRELKRVEAFVGATGRDARGLLIRGEAGIGKSAIWRVALDRLRAAGHCVLVTRPAEEELQGSMVGLLDLFETIETEPSVLDPDADVFDRGRAILRTLRRLTASRPTVLAIDDLQWLDPISLRSLRYALRRLEDQPVSMLATERSGPGEPPGPLLLPPERTEELTVGALSIEAIRLVIAPVVGAIPRPALDLIQQMSAGNPMYALELARTTDPGGNRLTTARRTTLRGILSARLAATPPDVLDVLRTAAALGPAPSERLMAACGEPECGPQIAAAVELGLLTVDESFIVRFTHPLLASVVLGEFAPAARREAHSRLAAFVAEPDDRARHLALSTIEPDADVAAELDAAADRASRRGAPGLAAELIAHWRAS
jgi:AAA ATPase domain